MRKLDIYKLLEITDRVLGGMSVSQWRALAFVRKVDLWRAFGLTWIRWIVCVFTHSVHGVEFAREVWAAWRSLCLPD